MSGPELAGARARVEGFPASGEGMEPVHERQFDFRTEEACREGCPGCAERRAEADRNQRAADAAAHGGLRADINALLGPGWLEDEP